MLPLFIIAVLFILPSQPILIIISNQEQPILRQTYHSTCKNLNQNSGTTHEDPHSYNSLHLAHLAEQDSIKEVNSIKESFNYQLSWWSHFERKVDISILLESTLMTQLNGIKIDTTTKSNDAIEFEAFLKKGMNKLSLRVQSGYLKQTVRVFTITENQIQIDKNKINKNSAKNNLLIKSGDNLKIKDDIKELFQPRILQEGSFGGDGGGGSSVNTTNTPPTQNNTVPQPSVTPQTPSENSSVSNSNTNGSIITLLLAISIPIATIVIISVTCFVLKNAPQPEQTDCAVTTSQTNVGTTADSSATDPNQGMHPIQQNIDRLPQPTSS